MPKRSGMIKHVVATTKNKATKVKKMLKRYISCFF